MKKLLLSFALILVMIGVSGCMSNKAEDSKTIALEYLMENYNDEFTPLGYQKPNWAYDYEVVTFKSKKYNERVSVRIYKENKKIKDDYFKLSMYEEACNYFSELVQCDANVDVKVRFNDAELPEGLTSTSSLNDYLKATHAKIDIYYFINIDLNSVDIASYTQPFVDNELKEKISIVSVHNVESIKDKSIDELLNGATNDIIQKARFEIIDDLSVKELGVQNYEKVGG